MVYKNFTLHLLISKSVNYIGSKPKVHKILSSKTKNNFQITNHKLADISQTISTTYKEIKKKCKYFNSGYCKFQIDCKFLHPETSCNDINEINSVKQSQPNPCRYKDYYSQHSLCVHLHKPEPEQN